VAGLYHRTEESARRDVRGTESTRCPPKKPPQGYHIWGLAMKQLGASSSSAAGPRIQTAPELPKMALSAPYAKEQGITPPQCLERRDAWILGPAAEDDEVKGKTSYAIPPPKKTVSLSALCQPGLEA
jgi:hypothetical protein